MRKVLQSPGSGRRRGRGGRQRPVLRRQRKYPYLRLLASEDDLLAVPIVPSVLPSAEILRCVKERPYIVYSAAESSDCVRSVVVVLAVHVLGETSTNDDHVLGKGRELFQYQVRHPTEDGLQSRCVSTSISGGRGMRTERTSCDWKRDRKSVV